MPTLVLTPLGTPSPSARVYHNVAQTLTTGALTVLAFNSERFDTDTIHDTAVNNSRLTCKTAGKYLITGSLEFAANAAGVRQAEILLQGASAIAYDLRVSAGAASSTRVSIATLWELGVNDYVELRAFQDSGGNLNVTSGSAFSPEFSMVKV